jgi:hypothetical protein
MDPTEAHAQRAFELLGEADAVIANLLYDPTDQVARVQAQQWQGELEDLDTPSRSAKPVISSPLPEIAAPARVRWEDLDDHEARCPRCLHWWVSHGVPSEEDYGCSMPISSMDERERGIYEVCGCTFAEGNSVTPRQVRIWHDGSSWPLAPWDRAACSHHRRGPIRRDDSQECMDCGVVFVSDG